MRPIQRRQSLLQAFLHWTVLLVIASIISSAHLPAQTPGPSLAGPAFGAQPSLQENFHEQLFGDAGLKDHGSIIPLPPRWPWVVSIALAILVSILVLSAKLLRKHRRKLTPVIHIPADVRALEALEKLKPLLEKAEARQFSYEASEIIRHYIEERFGLSACNRTTREFLDELVRKKDPQLADHTAILSQFLSQCDMAKYASMPMTSTEIAEILASARQFVIGTKASIIAESSNGSPNPQAA